MLSVNTNNAYSLLIFHHFTFKIRMRGDILMDYKALGRRIREERLKRNLTQEQLAEAIEISNSYMGQIERGELT